MCFGRHRELALGGVDEVEQLARFPRPVPASKSGWVEHASFRQHSDGFVRGLLRAGENPGRGCQRNDGMGGKEPDQRLGAGVAPWVAGAFAPGLLEANESLREVSRLCRRELDRLREDGAPFSDALLPKCRQPPM